MATGSPSPRESGRVKLDPSFLQLIFDWREEEEERPGAMRARAREMEAALNAELEAVFSAWEEGRGDLAQVEDRLSRLTYVTGLSQEREDGEHRH